MSYKLELELRNHRQQAPRSSLGIEGANDSDGPVLEDARNKLAWMLSLPVDLLADPTKREGKK